MICNSPGERVHEGAERRNDIHVSLCRVLPALVIHHYLGHAVDLCFDVAASDVAEDPELGLVDWFLGEWGDFAKRNGLVDLAGQLEVKELQTFDDPVLKWCKEDIVFDLLSALFDLAGCRLEVILDVDEMDELCEGISVVDDLSVYDLYELEEIKIAVVLQGFIECDGRDEVTQQLREGKLNDWEIRLITCTILHKSLKILLACLVVAPEWEAG